jgi:isoaspartyl peptidase/L-asparaginase-like protein (Ntn-hydrolase superfamily)
MYSIIVHGGVGAVPHDKKEAVIGGVRGAVLAGSDVLAGSGSSLDAVETAIKALEDNPLFNAGTGSVLTFDGEVEMDAAVDEKGEVTAGTSTGGVFLKLLGRVGETPLPGAGTYATKFGGASSTRLGESMMRTPITKTACDFMRMGLDAQGAASSAVNMLSNILGVRGWYRRRRQPRWHRFRPEHTANGPRLLQAGNVRTRRRAVAV